MMEQPICICGKRAQVYKNKESQYYVQCNNCQRSIQTREKFTSNYHRSYKSKPPVM